MSDLSTPPETRSPDAAELDALLALSLASGLGARLTRRCLDALSSARAVLDADVRALTGVEGIGSTRAAAIRQSLDALADGRAVARERELLEQHGARIVTMSQDEYPKLLRHIPDPPPILYVRGRIAPDDAVALAIVGARKCSHYGREQADRMAALLAAAGLCIVSGGAYGIDTAAHRAALRAGGRTIAVLGSGLAKPYPPTNTELFDQIVAEDRGAVVSELPMGTPPQAENFPPRNRIVSGMSLGVLVIEASNRSGALITARQANDEHGREVMALPGRVDSPSSEGCHKVIREGWATLVTNAADVLDALGETGQLLKAGITQQPGARGAAEEDARASVPVKLTETQQRIVDALKEPQSLDALCAQTALPVHVIQSDLTLLQIRGLLKKSGGEFVRCR